MMKMPEWATTTDDLGDMAGTISLFADGLAGHPDALDHLDLDGAIHQLRVIADAQDALSSIRGRLEREVMKRMSDTQHEHDGVTVERKGRRERVKWDNARLAWVAARKAREDRVIDEETGEAEPMEDTVARGLIDAYGLDVASKAPRSTWLKAHDIDPDDYREFEWGPPRLVLHRPERKRVVA